MASNAPTNAVSAPPAPVRKQLPAPTRSAVPVVPQLTNGHADAYAQSRNANHASQKNAQHNAASTTPASVRPANAAAQAQALRDRQQAAANAAAQQASMQQSSVYQPKASTSRSERDDIRDFWLGLSQAERKQMVTMEKQSVLRKMKEAQRHNCTCAVCGRKRNLIEQELEVLYNAYTNELETYAAKQRDFRDSNGKKSPPPGPGPFPGSIDPDGMPRAAPIAGANQQQPPPQSRKSSNGQNTMTPKSRTASHHHHHHPTQPPASKTPHHHHSHPGKNHSAACPRNHHSHPHDQYHDHDVSDSESEGSEEEDDEDEEGDEGTNGLAHFFSLNKV